MNKKHKLFAHPGVQSIISALLCILLGLVVGFVVLLVINPDSAFAGITSMMKNFLNMQRADFRLTNFGNTLVKTAPLILCSLSVLFAYKAGLFNIGAAGQYVIGAGAALYCALGLGLPWYLCLVAAMLAGALLGSISGLLKSFCNVNEVISCIMLNWISLYIVNILLSNYSQKGGKDTLTLISANKQAILPSIGMDRLFGSNRYVTIAIPIAILVAILVWVILEKTKFGYELRATGNNRFAAKYSGMKEKQNTILTMAIAGALAGMAAGLFFLTDFSQWDYNQSSVPSMGFNGIAAAFLGGLNPIGAIFSSYFIQHITDGGAFINRTFSTNVFPPQISELISSLIIYLCSFVLFFKLKMNKAVGKAEERARVKTTQIPAKTDESEKGGEA